MPVPEPFWAEERFDRLDFVGAEQAFAYAYPSVGLLAVLYTGEKFTGTPRCDPSLFGLDADGRVCLQDIATGERAFAGRGAELANGVQLEIVPDCAVLWKVARE